MPLNEFNHYFVEAKLTSKQRNKLDDTQFGIPSLRKYPLTDKKHVLQAVRFLNKAPEEHKPELARNIVKRAKELNMDWEKWDVLKPYLNKPVKEAYSNELHSTPEADGCIEALKDVEYDNASPDTWRLKTPLEVLKLKKGNCHDTSYFVHNRLNGHKRGVLFFIEYADGKQEGGQTHSVCYEKIPHGICVIECSWEGMKGTFPYNDINEYIRVVKRNWKFTNGFDKLYSCEIKNFDKIKPGISLGEYVEIVMKNKEIVMESFGPEDENDDYESSEPDDCYCESHDINGLVNANMIASRIHDKYKKDGVGHVVGNQNCQLCTWCAEAQFRGRNDMPRPIYSPRDPALEIVGEDIVKNPRRISLKPGFDDLLYHITEANNSRWYCHVKWVDGNGGHEFLILNIDGKPYLMDPQQGTVDKLLETHEYIKDTDWSNSYICRLDTNELNVKLLEEYNDMSKLVPWDGRIDIPYMLKEGLLTEDEAEQYWKEHPDERPDKTKQLTEAYELPAGIGLRPANEKDLPMILEWTLQTMNSVYRTRQKVIDMINKENKENIDTIKIITDGNKDIGMYQAYSIDEGEWWYLAEIYLIPSYCGKGIGSTLIKKDIDSHDKLVLRVDPDNVRAIKLYESLGFVVTKKEENSWIMRLDKTKKSKIFESGAFAKYGKDVDLTAARGPIQEGFMMEFDHNSEKIPVTDKSFDKLYFGSPTKYDGCIELDRPLFVSPFIGIASIFIYHDLDIQKHVPRGSYNLQYEEWLSASKEKLSKPLKDVHVYVEGYPELEPYEIENTGYIHVIDGHEYAGRLCRYDWMAEDLEYLIDNSAQNEVHIDKVIECTVRYHISGKASDNPKYGPYKKTKQPIQEGAWQDIKNGVNPWSKKLFFHVTKAGHYDGQIFKPRVPDYIGKYDPDDPYFEDGENPRICFSNSIEGALNAILVNIGRWKTANKLGNWYVYIPEKPINEYKHRTTKQLVKEKKVYDANITNEVWIEEPVRLKQYGIIHIDQVSEKTRKKTVESPTGQQTTRSRYTFKWHWLVKPKILKDLPYDYSPPEVCKDLESEMWGFKYGLIVDGRLRKGNVSEDDFAKHWTLSSPDEFEEAKGGNCDDYVAWEAGYLDTYGVSSYNKYFMEFDNNHHSFIVVNHNGTYIVIDGSIRHIVKDTPMRKECKSLDECFNFILDAIHKKDPKATLSGIYDFTKEKIDYGTPMKEYINWIKSHGKKVNMSKPTKEEYDMSDLMRDPDILRMIMEAEAAEEEEEKEDKEEKDEEKDDVETKDDDSEEDTTELKMSLDEIEFGADTSDIQNEYDTKEVDTLNDLIAAESQALSEYLDAAKTSKVPLLSRLYSDIGDEERFHLEQLLYAKSTLTGERYEPRDPEVRKEYEELMALGMDEETAMTTAVDKFNLRGSEEDVEETLEEVEETFNMIITSSDAISLQCAVLQEVMVDKSNISDALYQESMTFMENMYVMEEVDNLATRQGQKALGTKNPLVLIAQMYRAVYKLVVTLIRKAKLAFQKIRLKDKRRWAWIKKHGIRGLFQSGVHLYFYSDKTNSFEITTPLQYLKLIHDTNSKIVDMCKLNVDLRKYKIDEFLNKLGIPFEPIETSSIDKAVNRLNSVQLTKTKVVVTDKNEAELEKLFFDYTPDNYTYAMNGQADKIKMSKNIYHQMTIILDAFGYCNEETNAVIDGLENIAGGTPGKDTVFNTNPKLYNTCTNAMRTITKAVNLFNKTVTSDINQILSLDKGLREAVQSADQDNDMTKLNEYRKAQAEGQAAEDKEAEASKKDNNTLGSF
jgi:ribosomal protein S18 acetylase RimI-like enzyme